MFFLKFVSLVYKTVYHTETKNVGRDFFSTLHRREFLMNCYISRVEQEVSLEGQQGP